MSDATRSMLLALSVVCVSAAGGCSSSAFAAGGGPKEIFVAQGSVWKYLDDGSDQAAAWRDPGFDDTTWAAGPAQLGYGDGDEATVVSFGPDSSNKYITTYFRHTFTVLDPSAFAGTHLELLRDDGAVVYLNGTEVARSNMPAGPLDYLTFADNSVGGVDEDTFYGFHVDPNLLVVGDNVLAVEVHQRRVNSSDISFDLEYAESDIVVRGPYLQVKTDHSIVVRWRTAAPTNSLVQYGVDPKQLDQSVTDLDLTTEHVLEVPGLDPLTTYHYAIGTSKEILAGGDGEHVFTTAPTIGAGVPTRIWAIGDSGTANSDARRVRDEYLGLTGSQETDVWLMLGDNAYNDGEDDEYQAAVFDMYPMLLQRTALWPTLGNHDARSADSPTQSGVYYDIFTLPRNAEAGGLASGTEAYYSFDYGNVHFICLDSADTNRSPTGAMLTWLAADLGDTLAEWIIAYWHHPPYTKGSHDSDDILDSGGRMRDMRRDVLPILEAGGVDLVLCGHSHSYERSFLLDGHYGKSKTLEQQMIIDVGDGREAGDGAYARPIDGPTANGGAVYIVAGASGKIAGGDLDHPAMFVSLNKLGSLIVEIEGDRLDATYLEDTGTIGDTFTMIRSAVAPDVLDVSIGEPRSGDVTTLRRSDDIDVVVGQRLAASLTLPVIRVDISGTAGPGSVTWLQAGIEAAANAIPNRPPQRVSLFDHVATGYEIVDERASTLQDSLVEVTIDTNADRFVEAATGAMILRAEWFDPGNVILPAWASFMDRVGWEVRR